MTTTRHESREAIIAGGARNSIVGLSGLLGEQLEITSLTLGKLSIDEISERVGGADKSFTAVYLAFWGGASGHMTLLLDPSVTSKLLDLLVGQPHEPGLPFDEIERSALGELGNVVGSSFLNSVSDALGLQLRPSPPDVIVDMVGAVVDIVAADVMAEEAEAYLAEVRFRNTALGIEGTFLMVPSAELLTATTAQLEGSR